MSTGTKYGGATTGARYLERTILKASGNSEFLRDFLPSWMLLEHHVMSCQNGPWNFCYLVLSISIFKVYSLRMVLMHVTSLLYCWRNFIFSALSLSKYMSLLLNRINLFIITVFLFETASLTVLPLAMYNLKTLFTYPS